MLTLALGGLWLGWILPALFGLTAASGLLVLELGLVRLERSRVFSNLNSYLPRSVAQEIAFSAPSSAVNARRRNATLLSADLRNFSAFSEARPPEEIAVVLHYFISRASEIIENHGGQLQEFRGDGILAIWDSADTATARNVMLAANSLQQALNDQLLPEQSLQGFEPLALGIGIEQGPVLVGSIGPSHRRSHTILGDTVAVTLRIQEMTAELAQPVLVGECLARQLDSAGLVSQGSYLLPGLTIPHVLFAPDASDSSSSMTTPRLSLVRGGRR
jgi:class 3 adenylate cyclase